MGLYFGEDVLVVLYGVFFFLFCGYGFAEEGLHGWVAFFIFYSDAYLYEQLVYFFVVHFFLYEDGEAHACEAFERLACVLLYILW